MKRLHKMTWALALGALMTATTVMATDSNPSDSASAATNAETQKTQITVKNATTLDEILVRDSPYNNPTTPVTTRYGAQYNRVTKDQIKSQNAYDFNATLKNVPGVLTQSKNLMGSQTSHSLYIRGRGASHPSSDLDIEFDGVPRYGAIFGQVLGDSMAVQTMDAVEIFKSPQPSQFGNGYASINVLPRYMRNEGWQSDVDFSGGSHGTISEGLSSGIKQGPFDLYLSQSLNTTAGHRDHSRAKQENYYANTGYQLNDNWTVRLLLNSVVSSTQAPMPDEPRTTTNGISWPQAERFDTTTQLGTFTISHAYDKAEGYLKAYSNKTDFDLIQELNNGQRYAANTDGRWSRQAIRLYGLRAKEKLHLWQGGEILLGTDLDKSRLRNTCQSNNGLPASYLSGRTETENIFPEITLVSPYLALSQNFGKREGLHLTPSVGYRYFNHSEFKDKSASQAGLVAGYRNTDLNLNYARGVNYPTPVAIMAAVVNTLPTPTPDESWKNIKPEVVDHYEVGLSHSWEKLATLSVSAYRDKGKDRFRAYLFGPLPSQFNDSIGSYEIKGLELSGTLTPVDKLELFAAASWMDVEAVGANHQKQDKMPYSPGAMFQAGCGWEFMEHFKLYTDMQYIRDIYQGTSMRVSGFNYSALTHADKLDNITLVNTRLSYTFSNAALHQENSEIFVAVNNLFDKKYEYAKGYPMPGVTFFAGMNLKFR